jgi:hypothetical protein
MGRRSFVKEMAAMFAAVGAALPAVGAGRVWGQPPAKQEPRARLPEDAVVGIQMSPHTMLDEGIERCLDLIRETAAINVVMPYSHAFHASTLVFRGQVRKAKIQNYLRNT